MSRVFRMKPSEFWWENPLDPAAKLGYVRFTCAEPVADAWEVKFPRYSVEFGGWCASRNMRLAVDGIAERSVAEQIRDHILAGEHQRSAFDDLWAEVRDMGRAPYEAFDGGTEFWATAGSRSGQRGTIVIRNRDSAAVMWDDEPCFVGGTTYALDRMSATRPVERHIPHSMGWLKG
ncbi:hypothetical protein OHA84_38035 (plasmid) [Streptomyces sp. NBC_00513]|uniref:hypothetical protein n=1 Tax=unclassified Streptomyces TaxID=2593676 RepID=UPI0022568BEE|nr:hypothetical protein [Streptomyces sp. NBC_00424]MCX5078747.1 hypothetical protein [Streptomyces sp. NBC_00424]WUD46330.1 hypothetical protein OHA84_38035 [Streptomyces sp. NBC_00513]